MKETCQFCRFCRVVARDGDRGKGVCMNKYSSKCGWTVYFSDHCPKWKAK